MKNGIVWRTLAIPQIMVNRGHYVKDGDYLHELLGHAEWPERPREARLVMRCPRELGFGYASAKTSELFDAARLAGFGLKLCGVDAAVYLANTYRPGNKEYLNFAMKPVQIEGGMKAILVLYYDSSDYGCPEFTTVEYNCSWRHNRQFVFEAI